VFITCVPKMSLADHKLLLMTSTFQNFCTRRFVHEMSVRQCDFVAAKQEGLRPRGGMMESHKLLPTGCEKHDCRR